jgi:hypothetical protein
MYSSHHSTTHTQAMGIAITPSVFNGLKGYVASILAYLFSKLIDLF